MLAKKVEKYSSQKTEPIQWIVDKNALFGDGQDIGMTVSLVKLTQISSRIPLLYFNAFFLGYIFLFLDPFFRVFQNLASYNISSWKDYSFNFSVLSFHQNLTLLLDRN